MQFDHKATACEHVTVIAPNVLGPEVTQTLAARRFRRLIGVPAFFCTQPNISQSLLFEWGKVTQLYHVIPVELIWLFHGVGFHGVQDLAGMMSDVCFNMGLVRWCPIMYIALRSGPKGRLGFSELLGLREGRLRGI
jgi:hypothetical protein